MTITSKAYVDTKLVNKRDSDDYVFDTKVVQIKQVEQKGNVFIDDVLMLTSNTLSEAPIAYQTSRVLRVWRKSSGWTSLDIWGRIWAAQESVFYGIDMRNTKIRGMDNPTSNQDATTKKYVDDKVLKFGTKVEVDRLKEQVNRLESLVKSQQEDINKMKTLLNINKIHMV